MANKSIKLNYIYNVSYQILILLTPLITTPYVSRILGADGIGTYSFTNSIVAYFTIFAAMGTAIYGQRQISYLQDDKQKRSQTFWETELLSCISASVCLIFFTLFVLGQNDRLIYLILSINILSVAADISWFYQGIEEFKKITLCNGFFRILNIVYIFAFVKTKGDLYFYIFGIAGIAFLSNTFMWMYLPQYINKPDWHNIKPARNLKIVLSLFIPTIAASVYTMLDKTMIGVITHDSFENGYYEQAIKLSKMVLTVITSLGTVMIPRIGYLYGQNNKKKINEYMYRGYNFVWFLGVPLCFGLAGIAANVVPWFYGAGYDKVVPLLQILSFLILAIGISNVTGIQYLIPTNRQNIFTLTIVTGAIINFTFNCFTIPHFKSLGAASASVLAETVIALIQLYFVRKEFSVRRVFALSRNYMAAGFVMLVVLILENKVLASSIISTFIMIVSGACVYFTALLVLKDKFFFDNMNTVSVKFKSKLTGKNQPEGK